jgi:DNA recombination protein RmuC
MDMTAAILALLLAAAASGLVAVLARGRALREATATRALLAEAERRLAALAAERDAAQAALEAARAGQAAAEREAALANQRVAEFERLRDDMVQASRAAVLNAAQDLSSKLLEDHKRENEAAKKTGEEQVRAASAQLAQQVETIARALTQIEGKVGEDGRRLETVMRALSNPSGAGQFAEVVLANTLRSFGLEEDRDFKLQFTTSEPETGQRLRPDAVVFLPGNDVLVIDCKASKFLLEIAAAEGTPEEDAAYAAFARTMELHLKALAGKDYRSAVIASFRAGGFPGEVGRVRSIMYLPSESAVERLQKADPGFAQRAAAQQIIPAGPAGLACILGFASTEINLARQIENRERIVETTRALLDSLAIVIGHAAGVGRGIKMAAEGFGRFSGSLNHTLLPKARRLAQLGVQPGKRLPANLPAYEVLTGKAEAEAELEEAIAVPASVVPLLAKRSGDG